jgi:hypothetical protein
VTEPPPFRLTVAKAYGRLMRRRWFVCCMAVWMVCVVAGTVAYLAGWHVATDVRNMTDLALCALWAWVFAAASAQYYRERPDADWSASGQGVRRIAWTAGRWLARVLPPLRG